MSMVLRTADAGRGLFGAGVTRRLDSLFETLSVWHQRAVTRRELSRLDERVLHDIGLSIADVEQEVSKPFWRS